MENNKINLFIDMDGVLAEFVKAAHAHKDYEKYKDKLGLIKVDFSKLDVINGAIPAIQKLVESNKYNMYLASTAPWGQPESLTAKRLWIEKYFPMFKKKVIFTHNKELLCHNSSDIIIDDRLKNGVELWNGVHLHFGQPGNENWEQILTKLL